MNTRLTPVCHNSLDRLKSGIGVAGPELLLLHSSQMESRIEGLASSWVVFLVVIFGLVVFWVFLLLMHTMVILGR